ncbi:type I restriction endonuclease [Leptolyngbya sp. BC1307]|uniref:type I restriction endonuclease subunit R n=1 Tax=Leptolyngbya sp. BC1307 TaxID=2029589 RepID=UPI000EFB57D3|nr:type I restriction endonuclease [Leptolyngbya sp. BC1307]
MKAASHTEAAFESVIEAHLLANGYSALPSKQYDPEKSLFPDTAIRFIQQTQPKEWERLHNLLGNNTASQILADLCKWLDTYGCLTVLRHGFKCYGRTLRIATFKAAHSLNADLETSYQANQVTVTRQLHYRKAPKKSKKATYDAGSQAKNGIIDLTLSLNGIPLVTLELKNPQTGSTAQDAIEQYRHDRDPRDPLFTFKHRTLVHFAADTETVWMTTRLAGPATHFLPLNKGHDGGAGNPPDPAGRTYRTAYLWETILQRDSFLDLLARFLHLQIDEKHDDTGRKFKKETLIFPRYHQLQTVRALEQAAKAEGPGHNYLIEHSAGSGKSNTIGWLTHRLASLHTDQDERIFDSVIVITDRRVLDQQLQNTIYQFDHTQGVVQKIDKDSKQLAQALENATPIIITTLQKFPFVTRQLLQLAEERQQQGSGLLPTRRCAVIIDEAHSSQSGETATELKSVLGGEQLQAQAQQQAAEEGQENMEELFRSMAARSHQANLSFFAFTATPKHKTLKVFGSTNRYQYTMRQAIEEGFIMDVLRNYVTYKTYYKLLQNSAEDPNVERKAAARALVNFMRLHPHNIAQKTEVIVEHFNTVTRHKIGGRAKAMVVTGSRLEAVRYKQGFDKYIREKGYPIKTLVAFSGIVEDDKLSSVTYSETAMNNGIREKELPDQFATDGYQVLLVAEKYQTGFDQPLLHSMYIDRRLAGIQAVQTLSRLNRTHPLKEDTFVLDFVNDREEIREAFKQFYEGAEIGEEASPDQLYQLAADLTQAGIHLPEEIERFCITYFKPKQKQSPTDHQAMNAALDPAVERFVDFQTENEAEATLWRGQLTAFRNLYAFLSQVIPYQDSDLEKQYVFLRHLSAKLPKRSSAPQYNFDDDVQLEYYRLQKISEGSIDLNQGYADALDGPKAVGSAMVKENAVQLSQLIDLINDRFGADFNQADQLFFDQLIETATNSEELQQAAKANSQDSFGLLFKQVLQSLFVERVDQNEAIFAQYMNDNAFQKLVSDYLSSEVYKRLSTETSPSAHEA